jgi:antitoxin (DNA-binding transcriptional repressor) of toxin-antitoxin stability system
VCGARVSRAEVGEEVVIARDGRPIVTLEPCRRSRSATRRLGVWDQFGADIRETLFLWADPDVGAAIDEGKTAPVSPHELILFSTPVHSLGPATPSIGCWRPRPCANARRS